jgi:uncharacterized protein
MTTPLRLLVAVTALAMTGGTAQARDQLFSITALAPGNSPYIVNTAVAAVVERHVPGISLQVRATGSGTQHFVEAALGQVDFLFSSATINWLAATRAGPFAEMPNAPELEQEIGMIFSYQIGPYHYVARADSGIETLDDLRGKRVFAGPPQGTATRVVLGAIEQATGLTADDMQVQPFGWDAAAQAFQDGRIDVIVIPTNAPSPVIEQFALTTQIRLLDMPVDRITILTNTGGTVNTIAPDVYGPNQVNTEPVRTHGALVNLSARMSLDEDVVYQVTRAIWEHLDEIHGAAAWMPNTVNLDTALEFVAGRVHPGARRYYEEIGLEIPEPITYGN